ncbi:hypothetical protein ACQKWADRAFT_232311 [Trichoderma austrokoningii]
MESSRWLLFACQQRGGIDNTGCQGRGTRGKMRSLAECRPRPPFPTRQKATPKNNLEAHDWIPISARIRTVADHKWDPTADGASFLFFARSCALSRAEKPHRIGRAANVRDFAGSTDSELCPESTERLLFCSPSRQRFSSCRACRVANMGVEFWPQTEKGSIRCHSGARLERGLSGFARCLCRCRRWRCAPIAAFKTRCYLLFRAAVPPAGTARRPRSSISIDCCLRRLTIGQSVEHRARTQSGVCFVFVWPRPDSRAASRVMSMLSSNRASS